MEYFLDQLRCVLQALLVNAFNSTLKRSALVGGRLISVELSWEMPGEVFAVVANWTSREPLELRRLANRATLGAPDWIGVSSVHMACQACEFTPPQWIPREDGFLEARVQVGAVRHREMANTKQHE